MVESEEATKEDIEVEVDTEEVTKRNNQETPNQQGGNTRYGTARRKES